MSIAKILKPFLYAEDHIHAEQLVVGDERDFPAHILPGLVAEGFVELPASMAPEPAEPAAEPPAGSDAAPAPVPGPAKPARQRA